MNPLVPSGQSGGLKIGSKVKVPDGRIGTLRTTLIASPGTPLPGTAGVEFLDDASGRFRLEGFLIADLQPPS